jgi:phenol/toluene 2-monooxygenase (NADH) P5/A5
MPYQFFDCEVINVINETDVVKRFFIKVPDEMYFTFIAGQFVRLDLPIDHKEIDRSYSIASPPSDDNIFELLIVLKPTGIGTNYLFHHVEKGSAIKVSKALGKFRLPEIIDLDICFVCTGTGIAPLRSMLLDLFNKNIPHKNIFLIFGNRFEKDILYRKEMEKLEQKHPEFKFIPVLSRDNPGWSGHKGYVHEVYEKMFAHHPGIYFYLCGWKEMLREARERIAAMGYDKKHIKFEVYD